MASSDEPTMTVSGQEMQPATEDDLKRDEIGYTNPNLHRRLEVPAEVTEEQAEQGILSEEISISLSGVNSYRMTNDATHSEESTDDDIP